ncbi:hypothetical protein AVEN_168171-1 [Araneus ventricosus]|uniref:Uncharacterized protein n=1 Tax=Araneus ventricosus TaxID=182803 RepID=A0A4Y2WT32_ARAVE|nr:hypothetical protein AVEN_168171-1 [Araneus ventricosus]
MRDDHPAKSRGEEKRCKWEIKLHNLRTPKGVQRVRYLRTDHPCKLTKASLSRVTSSNQHAHDCGWVMLSSLRTNHRDNLSTTPALAEGVLKEENERYELTRGEPSPLCVDLKIWKRNRDETGVFEPVSWSNARNVSVVTLLLSSVYNLNIFTHLVGFQLALSYHRLLNSHSS